MTTPTPAENGGPQAPKVPADDRPVFVQDVRGRPYSFSGPLRTAPYLLLAPIGAYAATLDVVHLAGIVMVIVGLAGGNPRLSPVGGGCLPFLLFVLAGCSAAWNPHVGLALVAWSAIAWFAASIELRLTMKPYESPATDEAGAD